MTEQQGHPHTAQYSTAQHSTYLIQQLDVKAVFSLGVREAAGVRRPKVSLAPGAPPPGLLLPLVLVHFHHVAVSWPRRIHSAASEIDITDRYHV